MADAPPTLESLALAAKAGDRAAYDRLALGVWPWVRGKARRYARQCGGEADELEAVGIARLPLALRSYTPEAGGFLNYFAAAAGRKMAEVARRRLSRPEVQSDEAVGNEPDRRGRDGLNPEVVKALADLDPVSRALVGMMTGYDGEKLAIGRAAVALGLSDRRAERLWAAAFNRLSDLLRGAAA